MLKTYGLTLPDSHVIYGDFWMNSGEKLAEQYISGERRLPQAIICANDYMAYGLCDKFLEHGTRVPEDVTIIGYEYVGERFYHSPVLTTYQRNRKAVGIMAVNRLYEMITGKKTETVSVGGYMIFPLFLNSFTLSRHSVILWVVSFGKRSIHALRFLFMGILLC